LDGRFLAGWSTADHDHVIGSHSEASMMCFVDA